MHSIKNSIYKRFYSLIANPRHCKATWGRQYWKQKDGFNNIACQECPKFDATNSCCIVPFGTPLRKCVVAAMEAHLHSAKGKHVLEIGFGRFSLGKNLVNRSGGLWTGVEPHQPRNKQPRIGHGSYGHTEHIPFPDQTFDMVFAIQSFEHWGQKASGAAREPSDYNNCLNEILRVLKPGGSIYLDAPIHLHGHEMFIMGDIPRITALFTPEHWKNITIERWGYDHKPLTRDMASQQTAAQEEWSNEISSYDEQAVNRIIGNPIWLFTISAVKK